MPSIYVASLTDYNNAFLHGVWIEIEQATDLDEVHEQISKMLADSPACRKYPWEVAEEFAIHDYEGFGSYEVGEYANLATVLAVAQAIEEHGTVVTAWIEAVGGDPLGAIESFADAYCGTWTDEAEWAWDQFEALYPEAYELATSGVPGISFDPEDYVKEMSHENYTFIQVSGGVTVLRAD